MLHTMLKSLPKCCGRTWILREEQWFCISTPRVAEKYIGVVQVMYENLKTLSKCAVGSSFAPVLTQQFIVEVGASDHGVGPSIFLEVRN